MDQPLDSRIELPVDLVLPVVEPDILLYRRDALPNLKRFSSRLFHRRVDAAPDAGQERRAKSRTLRLPECNYFFAVDIRLDPPPEKAPRPAARSADLLDGNF